MDGAPIARQALTNHSFLTLTDGFLLNDGAWVDVSIMREDDTTMLKINGELMAESTEPIQLMTTYQDDPFSGAEGMFVFTFSSNKTLNERSVFIIKSADVFS